MNRRLILSVALLLLPVAAMAQATANEWMDSAMARARITAARKAAPVTVRECLADLSSWEAKDNADDKAKLESPNFWYQKLSTEELVRLSRESISCGSVLRRAHHQDDVALAINYGRMFDAALLYRAEAVLVEHHLMHEYLLKSSE